MRKITREACQAFENGRNYKKNNTQVISHNENKIRMYLHGNVIAYRGKEGTYISNGGWPSRTTKERLNGLTGVHIQQRNFVWYLNGVEWNGEWFRIAD